MTSWGWPGAVPLSSGAPRTLVLALRPAGPSGGGTPQPPRLFCITACSPAASVPRSHAFWKLPSAPSLAVTSAGSPSLVTTAQDPWPATRFCSELRAERVCRAGVSPCSSAPASAPSSLHSRGPRPPRPPPPRCSPGGRRTGTCLARFAHLRGSDVSALGRSCSCGWQNGVPPKTPTS